eukprot:TRINITY_DN69089_c0_g1_i1.p1 TRINITY_DN69089_c0_g1~~TRINITY_DN69089_c0_g1_i1.p1  ORF type:complete len:470 (-),score=59.88 TRINITY_DN69089_c0_g1_i1:46-1455(-)
MITEDCGSSVDLFEREDDKHRVRVELVLATPPINLARVVQDFYISGLGFGIVVYMSVCLLGAIMTCGTLGWLPWWWWCSPCAWHSNYCLLLITYWVTSFHIFYALCLILGVQIDLNLTLRGWSHLLWSTFVIVPLISPNSNSVILKLLPVLAGMNVGAVVARIEHIGGNLHLIWPVALHLVLPDAAVFAACRVRLYMHRRRRLYPPGGAWNPDGYCAPWAAWSAEMIGDPGYDDVMPIQAKEGHVCQSDITDNFSDSDASGVIDGGESASVCGRDGSESPRQNSPSSEQLPQRVPVNKALSVRLPPLPHVQQMRLPSMPSPGNSPKRLHPRRANTLAKENKMLQSQIVDAAVSMQRGSADNQTTNISPSSSRSIQALDDISERSVRSSCSNSFGDFGSGEGLVCRHNSDEERPNCCRVRRDLVTGESPCAEHEEPRLRHDHGDGCQVLQDCQQQLQFSSVCEVVEAEEV